MIRIQAANPARYPYIAYIETVFPALDKFGRRVITVGSGTLIGPRLVLTAGHVVYDTRWGGAGLEFTVVLGSTKRIAIRTDRFHTTTRWRDQESRGSNDARAVAAGDLGVVILPAPVDARLNLAPLPFQSAPRDVLAAKDLNVAGYVAEERSSNRLYRAAFRTVGSPQLNAFNWRAFYDVGTRGGMSGGPIWDFNPQTGARTLWAVHTASYLGIGSAMRIVDSAFRLVQGWYDTYHPSA